jgi:hypothetical protein
VTIVIHLLKILKNCSKQIQIINLKNSNTNILEKEKIIF